LLVLHHQGYLVVLFEEEYFLILHEVLKLYQKHHLLILLIPLIPEEYLEQIGYHHIHHQMM
tara:strand:+ start:220 stop:402 length:183 start_codon:yes stop_codon:yes gene_type:complete